MFLTVCYLDPGLPIDYLPAPRRRNSGRFTSRASGIAILGKLRELQTGDVADPRGALVLLWGDAVRELPNDGNI